jgi:hypothetical protein
MIWNLAGTAIALGVATLAWRRSRSPGGFYDRQSYGMDSAVHRRYAILSLAFAVFFAATYAAGFALAGIVGLALYALIAILYTASFLQGAPDQDE